MKHVVLTVPGAGQAKATLDPAVLVDTRMALCCNSGGGKSLALRLIAEQVGNQIPTIVIDPEGEWATLRTHVQAVLVGHGGDVQADPRLAKKLARRLVELDCSAIIDLSELKQQPKRAFVREFLEGLLGVPRKFWGARFVILDEAHKFAPESGREAESRQAVIDLMDSGRKRGLGGLLATQRLSKIAKDATAEANNLMLGRFAQDLDLRRASDLLGFAGKSEWATIREFRPGEFYGMGPAFNFSGILRFRTNEETITEHPKPGARHLVTPPKPSKRVKAILAKMGDLPKEAEQEKDELASLRGQVRDLKKELRSAQSGRGKPAQELIDAAVKRAIDRERKARDGLVQEMERRRKASLAKAERELGKISRSIQIVYSSLGGDPESLELVDSEPRSSQRPLDQGARSPGRSLGVRESTPAPAKPRRPTPGAEPNGPVSGAAYRLLVALLQQGKATSRPRAALLSQLSPRSSTFRNAMSTLRNADPPLLRDIAGGELEATEEAHDAYDGHYEPLPEGDDLIAYWRGQLGGADQRLFDVLVEAEGELLDRPYAAEQADLSPASSTFRNAMSKLRRLGLMRDKDGQLGLGYELQ